VIGEQSAGLDRQLRISPGEAVRIFTGAPMPAGADAVVMQEDVSREGDAIVLNVDVDPGDFVRRRGCDLRSEGSGPGRTSGDDRFTGVTRFCRCRVGGDVKAAIVSTGDELVKPGEKIKVGTNLRKQFGVALGLLQRCGACATQ
jgi:molybdopterin molybdotransferase